MLKFQSILNDYRVVAQLVFYNIEVLDKEQQELFNELFYFNSMYFDANAFIKEINFQSYFLSNNRVLDNRENYTKIKIIQYDKILNQGTVKKLKIN